MPQIQFEVSINDLISNIWIQDDHNNKREFNPRPVIVCLFSKP